MSHRRRWLIVLVLQRYHDALRRRCGRRGGITTLPLPRLLLLLLPLQGSLASCELSRLLMVPAFPPLLASCRLNRRRCCLLIGSAPSWRGSNRLRGSATIRPC